MCSAVWRCDDNGGNDDRVGDKENNVGDEQDDDGDATLFCDNCPLFSGAGAGSASASTAGTGCAEGLVRCEDGLCRNACLPFAGCSLSQAYHCVNGECLDTDRITKRDVNLHLEEGVTQSGEAMNIPGPYAGEADRNIDSNKNAGRGNTKDDGLNAERGSSSYGANETEGPLIRALCSQRAHSEGLNYDSSLTRQTTAIDSDNPALFSFSLSTLLSLFSPSSPPAPSPAVELFRRVATMPCAVDQCYSRMHVPMSVSSIHAQSALTIPIAHSETGVAEAELVVPSNALTTTRSITAASTSTSTLPTSPPSSSPTSAFSSSTMPMVPPAALLVLPASASLMRNAVNRVHASRVAELNGRYKTLCKFMHAYMYS